MLIGGGLIEWEFKVIWKSNIPPSVKVFTYLLLKNRLLTREILVHRNFNPSETGCPLCENDILESALHLFFNCPYSLEIWHKLSNHMGDALLVQGSSVLEVWRESFNKFKHTPSARKKWEVLFSAGCWQIWKQCNCRIFERNQVVTDIVLQWIISDATLWERNWGGR